MKAKYIIVLLLLCIPTAYIHAKTTAVKSGKAYARLLESDSQRTIPGVQGADPITQYHFIVVWKSEDVPLCFFWRGENGWLSCSMMKAHKIPGKKIPAGSLPYTAERISTENIQKGDTLELTPLRGGKFPIPAEIPAKAKNTLYFKTANTNWLSLQVKKITTEPDVIMP